ncbi:hypothetical protein [Niabella hibiscisoli]|uniref:hypothetical protein n=1 Tax=Niabella hibiscisoli TaxID=1825928 RepID=UPI001F0FFF52|nr:hypothetical protein [Niabella hibiscisoli]MCH5718551.1 hypothetical protein [Niabella hibiscisoli]
MKDQPAVVAQSTTEGAVEKQEQIKKDNGDPGRIAETKSLIETSSVVKEVQPTTGESFGTSFVPVVSSSPNKNGIHKKHGTV